MEKLSKQLEALVIKLKTNFKMDEFFRARLRLTFYYSITAIVILGGASIVLYNTILSNFADSIWQNGLDPDISQAIIDNTQDLLLNRFLTIDLLIIIFIIILGFFVTQKTLKPIKSNMQKQKRFIADASHEFRTPSAIIISGLEVALQNKKLDFPLAKKTIENTLEEMREFSKLSNSLLDISKYDMEKVVEFELVDITELVKYVSEKNKNLAQLKNLNFEINLKSKAHVLGNKMELNRVYYNILDNAIKYTPITGTILVSDKIFDGKYILSILNSGDAIPKEVINRIFDPFFRGEVARNTSGAGLGLTLVKKIVENHKGTIMIKSELNKGTEVIISLPISS